MAISISDNIYTQVNRPLDFKFGPFTDFNQANSFIPISQRYHGLIFGIYTNPGNIAASNIKFYYYWNTLSNSDILELGGKTPVDGEYANQAAMIAAQASQTARYIYYDNASYWEYLGTTNGNISDYRRISFSIAGPTTNGNVLTIVGGVPTWQAPVNTSKWTDIGPDIYRNSRVLIGGTTFSDSTSKFEVNGNTLITGTATINNTLSLRASSTASPATQIPVFTSNPASTTRTLTTRTPAQLLADMGGISGSLTANYIPKATGATTLVNSLIYEINNRVLINKITDTGGAFQVNGSIQLTSNIEINESFGLWSDASNRVRMIGAHGWEISSWIKTVFKTGNVEIEAGTLSTRASSTTSPATQIPVFTADPSSTMRTVVTRTPAQLLGDIGGLSDAPNDGNYYSRKSATWVKLYGQAADVPGGVPPASPLYIDPSDGNYIEVYTGFGEVVIDGIKGGYEGREIFIWGNQNYEKVVLKNNVTTISASDRFSLSASLYSALSPNFRPIHLIYIDSRWRVVNS